MKVSLVNVVMLGSGVILLYSGIKGYDPRGVIRWGLGGKKPEKMSSAESDWKPADPKTKPPSLGGPEYPGDLGVPDPDDKDNVPAVYV